MRFAQVRKHRCIKAWFSGHFHLGQDYQDSITFPTIPKEQVRKPPRRPLRPYFSFRLFNFTGAIFAFSRLIFLLWAFCLFDLFFAFCTHGRVGGLSFNACLTCGASSSRCAGWQGPYPNRGSCVFAQTSVMRSGSSRDKRQQSRLLRGNRGGFEICTVNHQAGGTVRLDATVAYKDKTHEVCG